MKKSVLALTALSALSVSSLAFAEVSLSVKCHETTGHFSSKKHHELFSGKMMAGQTNVLSLQSSARPGVMYSIKMLQPACSDGGSCGAGAQNQEQSQAAQQVQQACEQSAQQSCAQAAQQSCSQSAPAQQDACQQNVAQSCMQSAQQSCSDAAQQAQASQASQADQTSQASQASQADQQSQGCQVGAEQSSLCNDPAFVTVLFEKQAQPGDAWWHHAQMKVKKGQTKNFSVTYFTKMKDLFKLGLHHTTANCEVTYE